MIDLSRYRRPALQFSGGKDSLACLFLLVEQGQLDGVTVYWVNAGDGCPETLAVIEELRPLIPRFVEVRSNVKAWRNEHGYPSDLVPASAHTLGVTYGMNGFTLSNRFDCCFQNLMRPLHERMLADGVDAVIRGTKRSDTGTVPAEGPTGFYDVILPLRDWSHADVFAYLEAVGAPRNAIYDSVKGASAPECLGCTAWWDDGKAAYLKARHPAAYREYQIRLDSIVKTIRPHLADLESEACHGVR